MLETNKIDMKRLEDLDKCIFTRKKVIHFTEHKPNCKECEGYSPNCKLYEPKRRYIKFIKNE
ncbi:MAG: hypothetical protein ABIH82_06450 [Candidatus Woesearchaeota archaeon]